MATKAEKARLAQFSPGLQVTYRGSPRSVASAAAHVGRTAFVVKTIKSKNEVVCEWTDGVAPLRFYAFAESLQLPGEAAK
jgi:hypothetical protein